MEMVRSPRRCDFHALRGLLPGLLQYHDQEDLPVVFTALPGCQLATVAYWTAEWASRPTFSFECQLLKALSAGISATMQGIP